MSRSAQVRVNTLPILFHENEVLLLLSLLAYNLTSLLRTDLETSAGACWDLNPLGYSVLKAGGRLIKHYRRLVLTLARAVTLTGSLSSVVDQAANRHSPTPQSLWGQGGLAAPTRPSSRRRDSRHVHPTAHATITGNDE
jgi:hypothetical protein